MFMQETPSSMVNVHKKMPKNTFFLLFGRSIFGTVCEVT